MLASAGMQVGKWSANDNSLLAGVEVSHSNSVSNVSIADSEVVSVLGLCWMSHDDAFTFKTVDFNSGSGVGTKRSIASDAAKSFDPVGWLAPVIIRAKIVCKIYSCKQWLG